MGNILKPIFSRHPLATTRFSNNVHRRSLFYAMLGFILVYMNGITLFTGYIITQRLPRRCLHAAAAADRLHDLEVSC